MMALKTRRLTIRLPEDLLARLQYRADVEGLPLSAVLREDLSRANARWRPPAPSTSGLSLTWPEAPQRVSNPCVNPPDTPTPVTHTQPVDPTAVSPDFPNVCQPPLKGGL